jgi:hypothetical protein
MRTKALLLTAALSVAGLATASAQVYSVNVVGYVNLTLNPGFTMIANQLDAGAGNNTVGNLMPDVPEETQLFKFDAAAGTYIGNSFEFGEWSLPNMTLAPGEGAFIRIPGNNPVAVTLVGEVRQGTLSTPLVAGFQIVSSQVPQAGALDADLGFPAAEEDQVYLFSNETGGYSTHSYEFGEWNIVPQVAVGQSFFVNKSGATTWSREFNVE